MRCPSCEPDYCACADFYAGRMQHWKGELMSEMFNALFTPGDHETISMRLRFHGDWIGEAKESISDHLVYEIRKKSAELADAGLSEFNARIALIDAMCHALTVVAAAGAFEPMRYLAHAHQAFENNVATLHTSDLTYRNGKG